MSGSMPRSSPGWGRSTSVCRSGLTKDIEAPPGPIAGNGFQAVNTGSVWGSKELWRLWASACLVS
jgi:hypothetical protein